MRILKLLVLCPLTSEMTSRHRALLVDTDNVGWFQPPWLLYWNELQVRATPVEFDSGWTRCNEMNDYFQPWEGPLEILPGKCYQIEDCEREKEVRSQSAMPGGDKLP